MIAATGPPLVAKAATATTPIVFLAAEDPVRLGLVASLADPGGNLTGVNFLSGELVAKQLELMRELVSPATRVAVLVNPANVFSSESYLRQAEAAARAKALQIQVVRVSTSREINAAFASFEASSGRTPFLSAPMPSSPAAEFRSSNWRPSIKSPRSTARVNIAKPAG